MASPPGASSTLRSAPAGRLDSLLARPRARLDAAALDAEGWEVLLDDAWRHGLLGPLVERLPEDAAGLPPETQRRLRRLTSALRLKAGPLRAAQRQVLGALRGAGLPAAVLKGIGLADRLLAHPDLRPSGDVDVLVPAADLDRAIAALAPLGWRLDPGPYPDYQRRHHHHVTLLREGAPTVELHHRASTGFAMTLEGEPLLARARPGADGALVLAPEDELVFLALHAARHCLERLGWLEDLLALVERTGPALDWATVVARARDAGGASATAFVFRRLRALGAPVPPAALASLGGWRAAFAERVRVQAVAARRLRFRYFWAIGFQVILADGPLRAVAHMAHHAEWFVRRRTRTCTRDHGDLPRVS